MLGLGPDYFCAFSSLLLLQPLPRPLTPPIAKPLVLHTPTHLPHPHDGGQQAAGRGVDGFCSWPGCGCAGAVGETLLVLIVLWQLIKGLLMPYTYSLLLSVC